MAQFTPSRPIALGVLVAAIVVFALHHWYFLTSDAYYPIILYLAPAAAFLALGGIINPQLLVALEGKEQPTSLRVIAFVVALAGLVCSFVLHMTVYGF